MADNLVRIDLSRFTARDFRKIGELGDKMRLLNSWFRREREDGPAGDAFAIYSGDRGPRRYAGYRIMRHEDGAYGLVEGDGGKLLTEGRTIDAVIDAIPDDFYYPERCAPLRGRRYQRGIGDDEIRRGRDRHLAHHRI